MRLTVTGEHAFDGTKAAQSFERRATHIVVRAERVDAVFAVTGIVHSETSHAIAFLFTALPEHKPNTEDMISAKAEGPPKWLAAPP